MSECVFCNMLNGKIPYVEIFSNEHLFAFLDIGPLNKGHVLIVSKKHYANIFETPPELGSILIKAIQDVGRAVMQTTGAGGFNVIQNNHPPAGQSVFHVHWHIVPRFEGDGLLKWTAGKYDSVDEMRALAERLQQCL